jgi:hypothetical protein
MPDFLFFCRKGLTCPKNDVTSDCSRAQGRSVNFITEMTGFYRLITSQHLSANARLLWFELFLLWNEAGFPEWLQVDSLRMMSMIDTKTRSTMIRARDQLISAGLLVCRTQNNKQPNKYQFVTFGSREQSKKQQQTEPETRHETDCEANHEPKPEEIDTETGHQTRHQTSHETSHETSHLYKLNKTKTKENKNDLFNIKKSAYGEFGNVWLSDDELMQLKNSHPDWEQWLNRLSLGKEMKGYVYHNDYAAILSWIRKQEDEARDQAYQELLDELH